MESNINSVDFAVLGESVAGIAATMTLVRAGYSVAIFDLPADTDRLDDVPVIGANALSPRVTGSTFLREMRAAMAQAGVRRPSQCFISGVMQAEARVAIHTHLGIWICRGVIFAANGSEPGLAVTDPFHGFGVSYSAASDAFYYAAQRVAVYGDSPRVMEHAWIASKHASETIVVVREAIYPAEEGLMADLETRRTVSLLNGSFTGLSRRDAGLLVSFGSDAGSPHFSVDSAALFVAQHLVADSSLLSSISRGNVKFAGLAAGVQYWDHAALAMDGERAARGLL